MSRFGNRAIGAALAIAYVVATTLTPVPAAPAEVAYDWSGFYFGGHLGYGRGTAKSTIYDPVAANSANSFGGMFLGFQGGYNVVLPSRIFAGVEADLSFANFYADSRIATRESGARTVTDDIDYIGRVRGRLGYAFDRWTVYGTGGFAWSQSRVFDVPGVSRDEDKALRMRTGWVAGAGAELAIAPQWSARLEYLYDDFGGINASFPSGDRYQSAFKLQTLRLGLNRKLGPGGASAVADTMGDQWPIAAENWNVHGQLTVIGQGYPSFRSPYQGQNSLTRPRPIQEHDQRHRLSGPAPSEQHRVLYQSGTDAGFGAERNLRARRLCQRRGAEVGLPGSARQHCAGLPEAHDRTGRRTGDRR